jgi:hypothetical protein
MEDILRTAELTISFANSSCFASRLLLVALDKSGDFSCRYYSTMG